MAQTFGFMLYVLGLGLESQVLGLGLLPRGMSLALALPSVSLTPSLDKIQFWVKTGRAVAAKFVEISIRIDTFSAEI